MIWLLLSMACAVAIAHLLKLFTHHGGPILIIFLGNYLFASLFSLLLSGASVFHAQPVDIALGAACGVFFLFNFLIYRTNIMRNGVSLSVSVMRASLLIPTVVSLLLFGEHLGLANYAGGAAVIVAFAMMARGHEPRNLLWLVGLFLMTGCTDLFYKLYNEFSDNRESIFLAYAFGAAFVVNLALLWRAWLRGEWRPSRKTPRWLLAGVLLGAPNQMTAMFFMFSLRTVPAAVAYPTLAACVVLGGVLVDKLAWKAHFSRRQYFILASILAGVVLLNLPA